jgi:hypothetical protein
MLKKDRARYIEALKQGLEKWRDYEEHRDKRVVNGSYPLCRFMYEEQERIGKRKRLSEWKPHCKYCFLYRNGLCGQGLDGIAVITRPYWLMIHGDEQSPLYGKFPDDRGRWDLRRADKRGLHYPLFRGVMRRAIEAELRRVSGMGEVSPFSEEA